MLYERLSGRMHSIKHLFRKNPTGVIIPAQIHRIPSELRSKACLGDSSARMGDLLGSPVLHPVFVVVFFFNTSDLSRFICHGRWKRLDPEEEKTFESGLPSMFT